MKKSHTRVKKEKGISFDRPVLEPNAAGIDVGSRQMFVSVPPDRDSQPVRGFDVFTDDLNQLADWLEGCGVTTVAMESTGVYWIPLFEILEQRKLRPCLVDARHMKNVPGRRTGKNANGSNICIRWGCCDRLFVPLRKSVWCGR